VRIVRAMSRVFDRSHDLITSRAAAQEVEAVPDVRK
jgi:hypothetical protein